MRSYIPTCRESLVVVLMVLMSSIAVAQGSGLGIPRTPSGRPDLSGTYDPATLTPLERPEQLGTKLILTEEEAALLENLIHQLRMLYVEVDTQSKSAN